ncbi:MAG: hypothetical protein QXV73_04390 [Candidatus Micrarchaeia archaeon]
MIRIYKSIEIFYQENPERRVSGEVDYGVRWKSIYNKDPHRITWVEKTGEVYVINLITKEVQLTNKKFSEEEIETFMTGWEETIAIKKIQDYFPEIII